MKILMKNKWSSLSAISAGLLMTTCGAPQEQKQAQSDELIVAAYYFPNYHTGDARHSGNPEKGSDWSEWELVKSATPRFDGHQQPRSEEHTSELQSLMRHSYAVF